MSDRAQPVLSALLLGAATGLRSFTGLAALALVPPVPGAQPRIRATAGRAVLAAGAAGEIVADKLPQAPDRTSLPGLAGRLAFAAVSGALAGSPDLAETRSSSVDLEPAARPRDVAVGVGVAVLASAATSFGGRWARVALTRRTGRAVPVALAEDLVAVTLAVSGARLRAR